MPENENTGLFDRMDSKIKDREINVDELKDFVFGKNQKANIKELGNYLSTIDSYNYKDNRMDPDNELAKQVDRIFRNDMRETFSNIESKIKSNKVLDKDELSILFLDAILNKPIAQYFNGGFIDLRESHKKYPFDPSKPIEEICKGDFLSYIQIMYNLNYKPKTYSNASINYQNDIVEDSNKKLKKTVEYTQNPNIRKLNNTGISEIQNSIDLKYFELGKEGGGVFCAAPQKRVIQAGLYELDIIDNNINKKLNELRNSVNGTNFATEYNSILSGKNSAKNTVKNQIEKKYDDILNLHDSKYKEVFNTMGQWINNYEDDLVLKINNLIDQINETKQIKNVEKKEGKNYISLEKDGTYVLTNDANEGNSYNILKELIKEGDVRKIDYSNCNNEDIKSYLTKNGIDYSYENHIELHCFKEKNQKGTNKYVFVGTNTEIKLSGGVKLIPPSKIKADNEKREQEKKNNVKLSEKSEDNIKKLYESFPDDLKKKYDNENEIYTFIKNSENFLTDTIIDAKDKGYGLCKPPIEGNAIRFGDNRGNLITTKLPEELRKSGHTQYLIGRLEEKWTKLSIFDQHKDVLKDAGEPYLSDKDKGSILQGLNYLNQWLSGHGDYQLTTYINDVIYSMGIKKVSRKSIDTMMGELADKIRYHFVNALQLTLTYDFNNNELKSYIYDIIRGTTEKKQQGLRDLGQRVGYAFGADINTSFLAEEIIANGQDIRLEQKEFNVYLDRINELFLVDVDNANLDEQTISAKKRNIDELYEVAKKSNEEFIKYFVESKKILPKDIAETKKMKNKLDNLQKSLNNREKMIENNLMSKDDFKRTIEDQVKELEKKGDLNNEERIKLRELNEQLHNEFYIEIMYAESVESQKEALRYGGIDDMVRGTVLSDLARAAGGIKGVENSDIYNDIEGAGGGIFNWTDANSRAAFDFIRDIAVEVVLCYLAACTAGAATELLAAHTLKLVSSTARGIKIIKWARNLSRIGKFAIKGLGVVAKLGIEGSLFYVNNTLLSHWVKGEPWEDTKEFLLDPKGYAKSIAFFGVLKGLGKLGELFQKGGEKAIQSILNQPVKDMKTLESVMNRTLQVSGVGFEFGNLYLTDNIVNIIFGDERASMTRESAIQQLGMILGLRLAGKTGLQDKIIEEFGPTVKAKIKVNGKAVEITVPFRKGMIVKNGYFDGYVKGVEPAKPSPYRAKRDAEKRQEYIEEQAKDFFESENPGKKYEDLPKEKQLEYEARAKKYLEHIQNTAKNLYEQENPGNKIKYEDLTETQKSEYELRAEEAFQDAKQALKDIYIKQMGSKLHEERRKSYANKIENRDENGAIKPRIKKTTDKEWIEKHGTNEVDIANTKFEDLPKDRQVENAAAATVAINLIYEKALRGEEITPEMVEEMSAKVHEERLKRNQYAKGGELDKPYKELPEVEKAKDRDQILEAIETMQGKRKRFEIEKKIKEQKLTKELYEKENPGKKYEDLTPKEQEQAQNEHKYKEYVEQELKKEAIKKQREKLNKMKEDLSKELLEKNGDKSEIGKKKTVIEAIEKKLEIIERDMGEYDIDFDPNTGTFGSFGGFDGFVEHVTKTLETKKDKFNKKRDFKNFQNNVQLTIDYMTKKIISDGGPEKMTFREWKLKNLSEDANSPESYKQSLDKVNKALDKEIVDQWLDNPQRYNSHGFDHTIFVVKGTRDTFDGIPEAKKQLIEKYGLDKLPEERMNKLAEYLVKMSAILHDFGYPDQIGKDKTTHSTKGAERFKNDILKVFEEDLQTRFGLDEKTVKDICRDMYNSVYFHGADKNKQHYTIKIEGMDSDGRSYGGLLAGEKGQEWENKVLTKENAKANLGFENVRISYKSGGESLAIRQALEFVKDWGELKYKTSKGAEVKREGKPTEQFIKDMKVTRIESQDGNFLELHNETRAEITQNALNHAMGRKCDFLINLNGGDAKVVYSYKEHKFKQVKQESLSKKKFTDSDLVEIPEEYVKSLGEINDIIADGGAKIEVSYDEYRGRTLNEEGDLGGAGLECKDYNLHENPLAAVRVGDNLDMTFARLIPSQKNAIFLSTLYNLENGGDVSEMFKLMEKKNKEGSLAPKEEAQLTKKGKIKIDLYDIFEEEGLHTDGWKNGKKQIDFEFDFKRYKTKDGYNLNLFKKDIFREIKKSGEIKTEVSEEILKQSEDLIGWDDMGPYSVRHMVGLRGIKKVEFLDKEVQITIDENITFNSDLTFDSEGNLRTVKEKKENIPLVEYHLWREGTALFRNTIGGDLIKSSVYDSDGHKIGIIEGNGHVEYTSEFLESPKFQKFATAKKRFEDKNETGATKQ